MSYDVRIDIDALKFLKSQDSKTRRILKDNLKKLQKNPYASPEASTGDREKVKVNGEEIYRIHISRSYTAFYIIKQDSKEVVITDITDIDTAHKMYD